MAEFLQAYNKMIVNEGGYKLHTVKGDTGGMTYAGIARNPNPQWEGWNIIDRGDTPPASMVQEFYKTRYWDAVRCDEINNQEVAATLFDFAVNAGVSVARKLAQIAVGVSPDGMFGPVTMVAINDQDPEKFVLRYALAKIARYRDIVTRNRPQIKFLLGWINRTLKGVS
ncbi:MAG: N-acetylmuramidase [Desulfobulbaceae bacterium]|nr:N-acetylmuramidase [Desulfobulbaceae bacterium]